MVNRKLAEALRMQGFSYKEIANQVGCSESWCKQNLKGVSLCSQGLDNETKRAAMAILLMALYQLENL